MTTTNTSIVKIAALIAAFGIAAMSFSVVPARAQTTMTAAQLQAQIAALQAQIAALQAQLSGGATVSITFTRDLTMGSRGTDVTALQSWLISKGFSIPAGPTGYFWTQTRAAVAAYQASRGIVPAVGYFGPITRARVASEMAATGGTTGGGTTGTGALQGGEGLLTNDSEYGDVESTIDEGDSNQKVVGVEFEAQDADLAVQRVDVEFDMSGSSGSTRLDKYVDSVSLYLDGKKLATADASDADRDGDVSTLRFSGLNGIVRENDTADLYVTVNAVNTIGADEQNQDIIARIPENGIRAIDAAGISDTYFNDAYENTFTVDQQAAGTLTITTTSDNPDDSQVKVDDTNTTDDVTLLGFGLRPKQQDATVFDLPVQLVSTGTNLNQMVQSVSLMQGSKTLRTKTVSASSTSATIVFDNIDRDLNADDTTDFTVVANIKETGGTFGAGDTLTASTTGSLSGWDAEDQNGEQIDTADINGSATGGTITFQTTGVTVAKSSATATKTAATVSPGADYTQYAINFTVTAGDDDIYIDRSVQNTSSPSAAGAGVAWATTTSSTSGVTDQGTSNVTASGTDSGDTATSYRVAAGTSRTFTLNVTLTATGTGYTGVVLTGINYDTDSNTNDSTLYFTSGLDTFKTNDVLMTTI
ncbi:MAG: peptidoglycan-binding domain-containing protein [Bacillota bacterium]